MVRDAILGLAPALTRYRSAMPRYVRRFPAPPGREVVDPFTNKPRFMPSGPDRLEIWEAERDGSQIRFCQGLCAMPGERPPPVRWQRSFEDEGAAARYLERWESFRREDGLTLAGEAVTLQVAARPRKITPDAAKWAAGARGDAVSLDGKIGAGKTPNAELLRALLRQDSGSSLRELHIGRDRGLSTDHHDVVDALGEEGAPALERLRIEIGTGDDQSDWVSFGQSEALFSLPRLRELTLQGHTLSLGYVDAPALEVLALSVPDLARDEWRSLVASNLPSLSSLSFWVGGREPSKGRAGVERIGAADIAELFERQAFENLKTLRIRTTAITPDACRSVIPQALAGRLERLEIVEGAVTMHD